MRLNQIKVLENSEIQIIHEKTLELLEKVGVKIESDEARILLELNGALVQENNDFVKFPESLVKEQLKKVPDSFKLWGSDGSFSFEVNTKSTQFATVGTPVKIYDPSSKK